MSAIVAVIEFKGDSENSYPFTVYPLNEECLQESGVYIFTKRSLNSFTFKYDHNICFIGSAEAIPNKLYNQQKEQCISRNAANSVCFMPVNTTAGRKTIEQDLLKAGHKMCCEIKGASFLSKPDYVAY